MNRLVTDLKLKIKLSAGAEALSLAFHGETTLHLQTRNSSFSSTPSVEQQYSNLGKNEQKKSILFCVPNALLLR